MSDYVPKFQDREPDEYPHPDVNPYLKKHRTYGPPVLTADEAHGFRGRWSECFGREAPLHVEIGTGNGFFLSGMAARHPDRSWLGVEIRFKRVILTAKKLKAAGATEQARVCRYDARFLTDLFTPGSVAAIYLNHPDPWPRDRQARNRLLQGPFVDDLASFLAPGGELRLKTDHLINVDALLGLLPGRPLELIGRSDDVNGVGPPWGEDDVVTNYQNKFKERGEPVYALRVRRTPDPET